MCGEILCLYGEKGAVMFLQKLFGRKAVERAAFATIEQLEQRRLLTDCVLNTSSPMEVDGNDNIDNVIVITYDSGTGTVTVTDSAASTSNCANRSVASIIVYGGHNQSATSTGADTIDASALTTASGIPVTLVGQDGNDTLKGGDNGDSLDGGDGTDSILGNGGNDTLTGDADNDTILGGTGADSILGGGGADSIQGGDDNDTLYGG